MNLYVKFIDPLTSSIEELNLTINKYYLIIQKSPTCVQIFNDSNILDWFMIERFEVINWTNKFETIINE